MDVGRLVRVRVDGDVAKQIFVQRVVAARAVCVTYLMCGAAVLLYTGRALQPAPTFELYRARV